MRVLIAGCGYVGVRLASKLLAAGHEVWGLRRRVRSLPDGIGRVEADLLDPSTLRALPDRLDAVVHAAAAARFDDEAYRDAYLRGPVNLIDALRRLGSPVRRLILVSSTSVYAQTDGSWVDEISATEPLSFSGKRMLEGEALLRSAPWPGVVVRFGGIYGPGRAGLLDRLRRGAATPEPGPPRYTNRIHREDCAGVLAHLLDLRDPAALYLGVDHEPVDRSTLLRWLMARTPWALPAPRDAPSPAPSPGSRRKPGSKRCSNARIVASGYRFQYPSYREGYPALLQEI